MNQLINSLMMNIDTSNNLISNDIIEGIFLSLQYEYKDDINKIIKESIVFLKENTLTNTQIYNTLKDFFWIRRDYIYIEFNVRFHELCKIIEKELLTLNESSESNDSNESSESSNSNRSNEVEEPRTSSINNRFLNLFNIEYINTPNNANIFTDPFRNNVEYIGLQDLVYQPIQYPFYNIQFVEYPINNNILFNTAIDMFNIILTNPIINQQPMNDVKNVINTDELDKLPIKTLAEVDNEKHKSCAICLDEYDKESQLRILNCEHSFHKDCIDKWLIECNYKCPVCRDDSNKHHSEV